ncbi:MAG: pimeloyl-ACP methyl ester carboxylesterase [Patiriisocius sp.]|jgi:pimeloyl-ACP methyl ester carboxylesterase
MSTEPTSRMIETNGIQMRVFEAGTGPAVLLIHGWPESWYSWRHQITYLAEAGYRVIAPDMRGYGDTDSPEQADQYRIDIIVDDVVGILDTLDIDKSTIVGHDWGAMVVWHAALLKPERFNGVLAMSVPYAGPSKEAPLGAWNAAFGDNFFYILYHNEAEGVAEAEYNANTRAFIEMLYTSPDTPRADPTIKDPLRAAGGWVGRMGAPLERPEWLTAEDINYYVREFERAGFRGGVNYYRNFDRNWHYMQSRDPVIEIPCAFLSGAADPVIGGADQDGLRAMMSAVMPDLREITLVPEAGHWVQQEAPAETNEAILQFLRSL